MYSRQFDDKVLTFEASGGLVNSSLIMQDRETDSFWAIMRGESIHGDMKGTQLVEMPVSKKMKWKKWKKKHPHTLVLSVGGVEDVQNTYKDYFTSRTGFGGQRAKDKRLRTKEPIFAFELNHQTYAVKHRNIAKGQTFDLDGSHIFLYRPKRAQIFHSTNAYRSEAGFEDREGTWVDKSSGCRFDKDEEEFIGNDTCPAVLLGFDTFWYNWSLNNPETKLLL